MYFLHKVMTRVIKTAKSLGWVISASTTPPRFLNTPFGRGGEIFQNLWISIKNHIFSCCSAIYMLNTYSYWRVLGPSEVFPFTFSYSTCVTQNNFFSRKSFWGELHPPDFKTRFEGVISTITPPPHTHTHTHTSIFFNDPISYKLGFWIVEMSPTAIRAMLE